MLNIKVLDCTLRDGGYVNNWLFSKASITNILSSLVAAQIDYIECGFLQTDVFPESTTLFHKICNLRTYIEEFKQTKFSLMINYGEYPLTEIPSANNNKISLRIAFKKHQLEEALLYSKKLINKGYEVSINPMHTSTYNRSEWEYLIESVNKVSPKVFTIVDTNGAMREYEIISYYNILDKLLDKDISIGFHSHNNMQLSLANAKCLLDICKVRELIIDSTLMGMGRGAGNLSTEVITQYLNDNLETRYDTNKILNIIEQEIQPIYTKTPWGHSLPYYLAALHNCHPNYAKYIMENTKLSSEEVKNLFATMPIPKRTSYDIDFIKASCNKVAIS